MIESASFVSGYSSNSTHCVLWRKRLNKSDPEKDFGFLCPDGSCTSTTTLCDGVANCPHGYDEQVCRKGIANHFLITVFTTDDP